MIKFGMLGKSSWITGTRPRHGSLSLAGRDGPVMTKSQTETLPISDTQSASPNSAYSRGALCGFDEFDTDLVGRLPRDLAMSGEMIERDGKLEFIREHRCFGEQASAGFRDILHRAVDGERTAVKDDLPGLQRPVTLHVPFFFHNQLPELRVD